MEDAYKWLFQATLGGEHAISSQDEVRGWMDREWAGLGPPHPREPMTVQLRPDGRLVRLNLRPFKASGGSKQSILVAFVESAQHFKANKAIFRKEWKRLGSRLAHGPIDGLTQAEWQRVDRTTGPSYPAIDHSPINLKVEEPAYRVIEARFCTSLLAGKKP